jgi:hypothetical protein
MVEESKAGYYAQLIRQAEELNFLMVILHEEEKELVVYTYAEKIVITIDSLDALTDTRRVFTGMPYKGGK